MLEEDYLPIRNYAIIGDCHGAALISRTGSIDWCCLERFDADPTFCRLLDSQKGGFFSLHPENDAQTKHSYIPHTNILSTTFSTNSGTIVFTDFMPLGRSLRASAHDYTTLNSPHWLIRVAECIEGTVPLQLRYRPSIEFARRQVELQQTPSGVGVNNGPHLQTDLPLTISDDFAESTVSLQAGERRDFVLSPHPLVEPVSPSLIHTLFQITQAFWKEWLDYCRYRGPYAPWVRRSALVLKLLTYAPSGAIVAAPTTSLPEIIGGERNWDYRYCWPRDVTFSLYSLASLGYSGEARRFAEFLCQECHQEVFQVQILYGIEDDSLLEERKLDYLEGYRNSQPVSIGNEAYKQKQLDVYGEILDWAYLYLSLGEQLPLQTHRFLKMITEEIVQSYNQPDQGLWESRGNSRQYVFGKIMSWVAVDRAVRLFPEKPSFRESREEILRTVLIQGIRNGHLVQTFDEDNVDAALLLVPLVAFPVNKELIENTVDEIQRHLRKGNYVLRYQTPDGLSGNEGAFLVCSFWLVDALLILDREDEARRLYENLLQYANEVGLYSEEINPQTHEFLGNFPQALTHLGVINGAVHLDLYKKHGSRALQGCHADRARHTVEATFGFRGVWTAFKQTGRVGRLWSSKNSMLNMKMLPQSLKKGNTAF